MATSRSKRKRSVSARSKRLALQEVEVDDLRDVPFVPDYELLRKRKELLNEDEIVAVGMSLYHALEVQSIKSVWGEIARIEQLRG